MLSAQGRNRKRPRRVLTGSQSVSDDPDVAAIQPADVVTANQVLRPKDCCQLGQRHVQRDQVGAGDIRPQLAGHTGPVGNLVDQARQSVPPPAEFLGIRELTKNTCATQALNQIRLLLTQIHAALERVFVGGRLATALVLELMEKFGDPTGSKSAGRGQGVTVRPVPFATWSRGADRPDLHSIGLADRHRSRHLGIGADDPQSCRPDKGTERTTRDRGQGGRVHVGGMRCRFDLHAHGRGTPTLTAAQILLAIGDGSTLETPGHLTAHVRIAPVTLRSGTSIRGEFPTRAGNRRLKSALLPSVRTASTHAPIFKTYYERKHAKGKLHNTAMIYRARRPCHIIFAMLPDSTYHHPYPRARNPCSMTRNIGTPVTFFVAPSSGRMRA